MIGVYFAATGLGNKLAGSIGEASQTEPISATIVDQNLVDQMVDPETFAAAGDFEIVAKGTLANGEVKVTKDGKDLTNSLNISHEDEERLKEYLQSVEGVKDYTLIYRFGYDADLQASVKDGQQKLDISKYEGKVEVFEVQDNQEFWTFVWIFVFTTLFGILLLIFLRKLKKLTHGAEEVKASEA